MYKWYFTRRLVIFEIFFTQPSFFSWTEIAFLVLWVKETSKLQCQFIRKIVVGSENTNDEPLPIHCIVKFGYGRIDQLLKFQFSPLCTSRQWLEQEQGAHAHLTISWPHGDTALCDPTILIPSPFHTAICDRFRFSAWQYRRARYLKLDKVIKLDLLFVLS